MAEKNLLKMAEQKFQSAAEKIAKDLIATCYKEPQTNADRIRAMTDEELEPTILAFKLGYSPWCDHHCKNEGEYGCDTCILNWLKQPAEGE